MPRKKKLAKNQKHIQTIGIMGTAHGVGVTHFCILMANYYQSVLRKKVSLIEWNQQQDFLKIERLCNRSASQQKPFRILGVDYYQQAEADEWISCISSGYEKIIVDFGVMKEQQLEFMQCDKQFVLGSLSEWQFQMFWDFLKGIDCSCKSRTYLIVFGNEESRLEIIKKLHISLRRIPFFEDAFTIDYQTMRWFNNYFPDL